MSRPGQPLRFVALIGAGWIGLRVILLWPEAAKEVPRLLAAPAKAE